MSDDIARFADVSERFDRAWRTCPDEQSETHHVLMSARTRIRMVGTRLRHQLLDAMRHSVTDTRSRPALTIDLWEVRATGIASPAVPAQQPSGSSWILGKGTFAASVDARFVSHALRSAVIWLDRQTHHIVGWYADADDVSLHQRGKPLQMLIALWASDRGVLAVHAACVARHGHGVLIPGRSGSGKSTTALACAQAGLEYLGDDWIGIDASQPQAIRGFGLYTSTYLDGSHARRFPRLAPHVIAARASDEEKSLLFLADIFPEQLRSETDIRAIALPRIVAERTTGIRPAGKRDALLSLAPTSVFEMHPRPGRDGIERLADLVQRLPAFWLDIGSDLDDIPRAIGEIIDTVAR